MNKPQVAQASESLLSQIKGLDVRIKFWLSWLIFQWLVQLVWYQSIGWSIGYILFIYGFGELIWESDAKSFQKRLLKWLSYYSLFFFIKGFSLTWKIGLTILIGVISPTKLWISILPLLIESISLSYLAKRRKDIQYNPLNCEVLIDEQTGEIIKEML